MNLQVILQQLQAEKGIDRDKLLEAIHVALESAAKKSFDPEADIAIDMDPNTLAFKVFEIRTVVDEVNEPASQISLSDAQGLNPDVEVGQRLKIPSQPGDFGRIAAQTAKQVISQKIRDAERENVFDEYKSREGEIVTGVVKRMTQGSIIVSLGRAEAVIPRNEQSPRESFKPGERIRAYLLEVDSESRGPQLVLSRTSPQLVKSLFEMEVPEIYDGTIEIKSIAREPGGRTKIAVHSNDARVDPVGACVGMKGSRVRTVVEELCGEKIDIVRWSDDPVVFCSEAMNPADILDLTIDEQNRAILVVVPHDQLSLAIGKRGQNARLASRLLGWNIDIKSDVEITGVAPPEAVEEAADDVNAEASPVEEVPTTDSEQPESAPKSEGDDTDESNAAE
jgi:N utilization substance protein A